jgi:GNAT superfamily N-acetyltransferase
MGELISHRPPVNLTADVLYPAPARIPGGSRYGNERYNNPVLKHPNEINDSIKVQINSLTALAFRDERMAAGLSGGESDVIESAAIKDSVIGYITTSDGKVVSLGIGVEDTYNQSSDIKTMNLHTFSTKEDYRGKGLCREVIKEFIHKYGHTHILYLTVRTEAGKVNESAIRSYEKEDFIMLPEVWRNHYDGKNNAMVRIPHKRSGARRKPKSKKRRPRKNRTKR